MNLKQPPPAPFFVETDGEVVVNHGWIEAQGDSIVALSFDLRAKYAEILAISGGGEPSVPGVVLSGDKALHINKAKRGKPTHIIFPEYAGWNVHCADVARYTLHVCLVATQ